MRTTYKQQMAAVKHMLGIIKQEWVWRKTLKHSIGHYTEDRQWIALNDAYSTLAALALNGALSKPSVVS